MESLENAVERIKRLECPTGEVENRIAGILDDYGVAGKNEIRVKRNSVYDREDAQAYTIDLSGEEGRSVVVLAKSGMDDYVAKVVDAYINFIE